jgi:hypothetical protein
MFTAYTFNTLGVLSAAFAIGFFSIGEFDLGARERTIPGLCVALILGLFGEWLSRRANEDKAWANSWFATNVLAGSYCLAYFYIYAMYYIPILRSVDTPYLSWVFLLALAGIGAIHGASNQNVRYFTIPLSAIATLHFLFNTIHSDIVLHLGNYDVQMAAIGCFAGMIWCGLLSVLFKRRQLKFPEWSKCTSREDVHGYLTYFTASEVYFFGAAACAALMPRYVDTSVGYAVWWSLEALFCAAISWRHGNLVKHVVVAALWGAAAWNFFITPFGHGLPLATILSVVGVGVVMAMAYRFESSNLKGLGKLRLPPEVTQAQKVGWYMVYLYVSMVLAVLVPYKQFGLMDGMPYYMGAALGFCLLGIGLRDAFVHAIGVMVSAVALVLFAAHFDTWTWMLVAPVAVVCYVLSIRYTKIHGNGGLEASKFLPYAGQYAISAWWADKLERVWSWVGFATLAGAAYVLLPNHEYTVTLWVPMAIILYVFGDQLNRFGYTLQAMVAFGLAAAKLLVWDLGLSQIGYDAANGSIVWNLDHALIVWRAGEFGLLGFGFLVASWRDFTWLAKQKATEAQAAAAAAPAQSGPTDGQGS